MAAAPMLPCARGGKPLPGASLHALWRIGQHLCGGWVCLAMQRRCAFDLWRTSSRAGIDSAQVAAWRGGMHARKQQPGKVFEPGRNICLCCVA